MIGRQVAIKMMKKDATNHHANSFQLKEKWTLRKKTRSGYIKVNINTKGKYAR